MAKRKSGSNRGPARSANGGDTDDITTLTVAQAKALVKEYSNRFLSLTRLARLSDETAKALAKHNSFLLLDGLTTLSDEAARALAKHKGGGLHLNGLTTLSEKTVADDGWRHDRIQLLRLNPAFAPIQIKPAEAGNLMMVDEFTAVVLPPRLYGSKRPGLAGCERRGKTRPAGRARSHRKVRSWANKTHKRRDKRCPLAKLSQCANPLPLPDGLDDYDVKRSH